MLWPCYCVASFPLPNVLFLFIGTMTDFGATAQDVLEARAALSGEDDEAASAWAVVGWSAGGVVFGGGAIGAGAWCLCWCRARLTSRG